MKKRWWALLILILAFIAYVTLPDTTIPAPEPPIRPPPAVPESNTSRTADITPPAPEATLPPGSTVIFYDAVYSSEQENLKGFQRTSHDGAAYETGFDINVDVSSTDKGVFRYIPLTGWFDLMGTTRSTSYSTSSINPITHDGRLFLFRHRGSASTLTEVHPYSGEVLRTTPVGDGDVAIVGENAYYRSEVRTDLYDERTGGGEFMLQPLSGGAPTVLLEYDDPANIGTFHGTANSLFSATPDGTVRMHDTQTGAVRRIVAEPLGPGKFIAGDAALYLLHSENNAYTITRITENGAEGLLEITLEPGERALTIDEASGKLLIVVTKQGNEKDVILYDIATGRQQPVATIPFGQALPYEEYQFLLT